MKRRAGVFILWICLLLLAKWFLGEANSTEGQESVIHMVVVISAMDLILCLPMLLLERYRSGRFIGYCALSLLIGALVTNAWWLGQAAGIASLFLSLLALTLEDLAHTWLFKKQKGHGVWILLVFHCFMLAPLNPMVRSLLGLNLDDALLIAVLFPVTIWRFVSTTLRVSMGHSN